MEDVSVQLCTASECTGWQNLTRKDDREIRLQASVCVVQRSAGDRGCHHTQSYRSLRDNSTVPTFPEAFLLCREAQAAVGAAHE